MWLYIIDIRDWDFIILFLVVIKYGNFWIMGKEVGYNSGWGYGKFDFYDCVGNLVVKCLYDWVGF